MQKTKRTGSGYRDRLRQLVTGILFLAVATGGWQILLTDRQAFTGFLMRGDPGPFLLPQLLLATMAITGLWLLAQVGLAYAIDRHKRAADRQVVPTTATGSLETGSAQMRDWQQSWFRRDALVQLLLPLGFLVSVASMPLMMQAVGSFSAIALFAATWIGVLGLRATGRSFGVMLAALGFGFGAAAATQMIFVRLLNVPLPQ